MRLETVVRIEAAGVVLDADLAMPGSPRGVVLFAHGSGGCRRNPRKRMVAGRLQDAGFATVLADLITTREERIDERTAALRWHTYRRGRLPRPGHAGRRRTLVERRDSGPLGPPQTSVRSVGSRALRRR
jgi:dienelactone hydrolase